MIAIITIDKRTDRLISSPDIITRGLIAIRDSSEMMENLRSEIRRQAASLRQSHANLDTLRQSIRDTVARHVYDSTGRIPIVIAVINVTNSRGHTNIIPKPSEDTHS